MTTTTDREVVSGTDSNELAEMSGNSDVKPWAEKETVRRYQPDLHHCPSQRVRTIRRARRAIEL
ncbi:hypothetical protein IIA94_00380 [Patescibacteria group bacterium]|nr:hypothetical protein [Patescibacteria group bacterium]